MKMAAAILQSKYKFALNSTYLPGLSDYFIPFKGAFIKRYAAKLH
jgi:hypothetical protein